ncbi:MAG TPA: hypothetical protein VF541_20450 [Longimicrobium sp.]|jgi:hypothetical protein
MHRLDPDSLHVQSFTTLADPAAQRQAALLPQASYICRTEWISCYGSCDELCDTHQFPCPKYPSVDGNPCA